MQCVLAHLFGAATPGNRMTLAFSDELLEPIQLGTKVHTFRAKKRWQAGTTIHFTAKFRRPGQYQFYPARPAVSVQDAEMTVDGMFIDGRRLEDAELEQFALRDGFTSVEDFFAFFKARKLPIVGQIIHWTSLRYGPAGPALHP